MQENILITGGCGFVGRAVVKYLCENYDYNLIIIDNLSNSQLSNLSGFDDKITFYNIDIRNKDQLEGIIKKCQYVIHLAANISIQISLRDPLFSSSVNISGFLNILELSQKYAIKKLVYASSGEVYGDCIEAAKESDLLNPCSPYAFEKMANEFYAKFYNQNHQLSCVGLRYFNIYGNYNYKALDYSGVIKIFLEKISKNQDAIIYGDGSQQRDFVYVDDVAKITVESLFIGYEGLLNVASGELIRIDDLFNLIKNKIGKKTDLVYQQKRKGEVQRSYGDVILLHSLFANHQFKGLAQGIDLVIDSLKL